MAKIKNLHLYGTPERIRELKEEYDWIARHITRIDPDDHGHLTVFAIPPKKKKKVRVEREAAPVVEEKSARPRKTNGFSKGRGVSFD